jgi:LmbE family N-acetylglucosaminyl deacetylase
MLTDGAASHPGSAAYPPPALARVRRRETRRAMDCLGLPAENLHFLEVPDGAAPHDAAGLADIVHNLCAVIGDCETLLVTWRHDPHGDHVAAYLAVRAAAACLGARGNWRRSARPFRAMHRSTARWCMTTRAASCCRRIFCGASTGTGKFCWRPHERVLAARSVRPVIRRQ